MNSEPVVMCRRIARTIGIAVIAALATSACAAGRDAQTANQSASLDGTNKTVGNIDMRALAIQPPPIGKSFYPAGGAAQVTIVMINTGRAVDTLTSISTPTATDWAAFGDYNQAFAVQQAANSTESASPSEAASSSAATSSAPSGTASASASTSSAPSAAALPTGAHQVIVKPGIRTSFGTPEATGALLLTGLKKPLYAGNSIPITFTFDHAGPITISVPVQLTSSAPVKITDPKASPSGQVVP